MSNSIKIGLTGNYLSGLEDVSDIFRRYGVPVFDCDLLIKYFLFNSDTHITKIKDIFGEAAFTDGKFDLSKFDNKISNLKFESVLKALEFDIQLAYEKWRRKHRTTEYTIFKSQILFEFGFNAGMNLNINVFKPLKTRVSDLHDYYNVSYQDGHTLLGCELEEDVKNRHSTYTIHNYDTWHQSTEVQISKIHKSIKSKNSASNYSEAEWI